MANPWEEYQTQTAEPKPWESFGEPVQEKTPKFQADNVMPSEIGLNFETVKRMKNLGAFVLTEAAREARKDPMSLMEIPKAVARGTEQFAAGASGVFGILNRMLVMNEDRIDMLQKAGIANSPAIDNMQRVAPTLAKWGKSWKDNLEKWSMEGWEAPDEEIFKGTFMENPSFIRGASVVAGAVPSLAAALAVNAATGGTAGVGAILLGAVESEDLYYKKMAAGGKEEEAMALFAIGTAGSAALEYIGLEAISSGAKKIIGKLPADALLRKVMEGTGRRTRSAIAKQVSRKLSKAPLIERVRNYAIAGFAEGTTESLQEVWNNAITKFGIDKSQKLLDGVVEAFIGGFGGGVMMTMGQAAYNKNQRNNAIKERISEFQKVITEAESAGIDMEQFTLGVEKAMVNRNQDISNEIDTEVNENLEFFGEVKEAVKQDAEQMAIEEVEAKAVEPNTDPLTESARKAVAVDPYKYQDSNQEQVIHSGEWKSAMRLELEGAGDIFRELANETAHDPKYINEKIRRLDRYFNAMDEGALSFDETIEYTLENDKALVDKMMEQWKAQPTKTPEQELVKNFNMALLKGNVWKAKKLFNEIKEMKWDEGSFLYKTGAKAEVGGKVEAVEPKVVKESELLTELKTIQEKINKYNEQGKRVPDSLIKRQEALLMKSKGEAGKKVPVNKILGKKPSKMVSMEEMTLLKERIKNIARGAREGARATKADTVKAQKELVKMLKDAEFLSQADRAAYLSTVTNIQSAKDFDKARDEIVASIDKKQELRQKQSLAKEITKLSEAKVDQDYLDQIDDILEGLDLKQRTEKTKKRRESRADFLQRLQSEGELMSLPKDFFSDMPRKTLDEMTVAELEGIKQRLDVIVHVGKTKGNLVSRAKVRKEAAFVKELIDNAYDVVKKDRAKVEESGIRKTNRKTKIEKAKKTVNDFFAAHRKVEFVSKFLNGLELTDLIQDGRTKHFVMTETIYPKLQNAMKQLGDLKAFQNETGLYGLTREQMVGVALNSGNTGNLERLTKGNGLTIEQILKVKESLTQGEKKFVDDVYKILEEMFPGLSQVAFNLTGLRPPRIDGKYFPIATDIDLSKQAEFRQAQSDLFQEVFQQAYVEHGFAKRRIGGADAVNLNVLDVITKHIDGVIHYVSFAEAVKDAQKVINNPAFRDMITDIYNESVYEQFPSWLKDVANPHADKLKGAKGAAERLARMLRYNATTAQLGIRLTVSLVQAGSFTQTINEIGNKHAFGALAEFIGDRKGVTEFVLQNSELMRNRPQTFDRDVKDAIERGDFDYLTKGKKGYREALFALIQTIDMATTIPTWLGAYNLEYDKAMDYDSAKRYADHVVRTTQPAGNVENLAAIMKGSEVQKFFTTFMSHFANVHNQMTLAMDKLKMGKDHPMRRIGDFSKSMFYVWLLPAFLTGMIKNLGDLEKTLKDMITYPLSGVFLLRDAINVIRGYNMSAPSALGGLVEAGKVITQKTAKGKIKAGVKSFGMLTGLVPTQLVDSLEGAIDLMTGETENWLRLIFSEYAIGEGSSSGRTII